ncbi:hypothetical protein Tco_0756963 [Tanacetum coccineum]
MTVDRSIGIDQAVQRFMVVEGVMEKVVDRVFGRLRWCQIYVIGFILKLVKFFNNLFSGHERFWKTTKSTISSIEICWWEEGFNHHVIRCGEVGGVVKASSRGTRGVGSFGYGESG